MRRVDVALVGTAYIHSDDLRPPVLNLPTQATGEHAELNKLGEKLLDRVFEQATDHNRRMMTGPDSHENLKCTSAVMLGQHRVFAVNHNNLDAAEWHTHYNAAA